MGKKIRANTKLNEDKNNTSLTKIESELLGISSEEKEKAYVALKYFDDGFECFSKWTRDEMKAFTDFVRKINGMSWNQIYQTGRRKNKTGFAYTVHTNREKLPNSKVLDGISEDINFFELRVNQKARVHGFRIKSTFFLVWLDREHSIYPM